jgi:hypothetical protein
MRLFIRNSISGARFHFGFRDPLVIIIVQEVKRTGIVRHDA